MAAKIIDVSNMNILTNAEGVNIVRAMCGCMGLTLATLQMHKLAGNHNIAITRKSKTVKRRSQLLDTAAEFNLVAHTISEHYANGVMHTYTITGLGFAVLQQMYSVTFYIMPAK